MPIIHFVNGYAVQESERTTYFIPSFSCEADVVLDLTILECVQVEKTSNRKYYEGYKVRLTREKLKEFKWGKDVVYDTDDEERRNIIDPDEQATRAAIEILRKTLNNSDCYGLTLAGPSAGDQPRKIEFWKKISGGRKKQILGDLELQTVEIVPSVGKLIEGILSNLQETAEKNHQLQNESQESSKQLSMYKSLAEQFKVVSCRKEDRLYRAFTHVLNEKKKRIIELEKKLKQIKSSDSSPSKFDETIKIKQENLSQPPSPTPQLNELNNENDEAQKQAESDGSETSYESDVHDSSGVEENTDTNQGHKLNAPCCSKSLKNNYKTPTKVMNSFIGDLEKTPQPSTSKKSTPRRRHIEETKQDDSSDDDIMGTIKSVLKKMPKKKPSSHSKGNVVDAGSSSNSSSSKKSSCRNSKSPSPKRSRMDSDSETGDEETIVKNSVSKKLDFSK